LTLIEHLERVYALQPRDDKPSCKKRVKQILRLNPYAKSCKWAPYCCHLKGSTPFPLGILVFNIIIFGNQGQSFRLNHSTCCWWTFESDVTHWSVDQAEQSAKIPSRCSDRWSRKYRSPPVSPNYTTLELEGSKRTTQNSTQTSISDYPLCLYLRDYLTNNMVSIDSANGLSNHEHFRSYS